MSQVAKVMQPQPTVLPKTEVASVTGLREGPSFHVIDCTTYGASATTRDLANKNSGGRGGYHSFLAASMCIVEHRNKVPARPHRLHAPSPHAAISGWLGARATDLNGERTASAVLSR